VGLVRLFTIEVTLDKTSGSWYHFMRPIHCIKNVLTVKQLLISVSYFIKNAVFWDVSPKRRFTQDLHGATSQKTAFFLVTSVKTSNLTSYFIVIIFLSGLCYSEKCFL
jgi:hypothetical protein